MDTRSGSSRVRIQGRGTVSAEGLRQAHDWPPVAAAAARASGSADYSVTLDFDGPHMALEVQSSLHGLQLDWPAPLAKPAQAAWPLRYTQTTGPEAGIGLHVGDVLALSYIYAGTGDTQAVQRGAVFVGEGAATGLELPAEGVQARVSLPALDVDAWLAATDGLAEVAGAGGARQQPDTGLLAAHVPQTWRIDLDQLKQGHQALHALQLEGQYERGAHGRSFWRAQVQAQELAGRVEYARDERGQGDAVRLRLSHLHLATQGDKSAAKPTAVPREHTRLPALDVQVDDFQLDQLTLGQLQVQAHNRAGVWELADLGLDVPEARLRARGQWLPGVDTELDFTLDTDDAGALLARLGMANVLRHGKGQLQGRMGWHGSPLALHKPSLHGALTLDMSAGQFLKADPGVAKLLGVLSLQALPRRLALDFRDIFSSGFAFDLVRGDAQVQGGVVHSNNLQMKGVNAAVLIDGSANWLDETQQLRVLVVPELDAGNAALAAGVFNPAIGLGAFVAQLVLKEPLMRLATREFEITGGWDNPLVRPVKRGDADSDAGIDAPPPVSAH